MKKMLALCVLPMLLAACQSDGVTMTPTTATGAKPVVCAVWSDLPRVSYASKHDTPETVASARIVNVAIDRNNAARGGYGCR